MNLIIVSEKPKQVIKKHINAIHCSNNLTLVQRKLFNALLFNAYHDMPNKPQYEISIRKLCNLIGYGSRDYKKIRKALLDLINTSIEWNVLSQNDEYKDEKWRASAIISSAKIESGNCTYEFSSVMRELLYQPEIYGKIDLNIMTMFGSGYGLALYENCIRFQDIPQTPWFQIEAFRKLIGVSKNSYLNFCDFKKRVLNVAIKEVNKFTSINITAELQRTNKKVTKIRFKLSNESKSDKKKIEKTVNSTLLETLISDFNLSRNKIDELLEVHESHYIQEKVELIKNSKPYIQGRIKNLCAYLVDALSKNYQKSNSSLEILNSKKLEREERLKKSKEKEEATIKENDLRRKNIVQSYVRVLDKNQYKYA